MTPIYPELQSKHVGGRNHGWRRPRLLLVLCWLVMFGNFATWMFSVATVAGNRDFAPYAIQLCATALMSFACAVLLRRRVIEDIQAEQKL
jgi:hypothetical protein